MFNCYGFYRMADFAIFEPLRDFDEAVLSEVVREGELRLQSQLQIASAADQRALTFAGFQITTATAAFAGGAALAVSDTADLVLSLLAWAFAACLLYAAKMVLDTVRPARFNIPGNDPGCWLPDRWTDASKGDFSLTQARIEQAYCLSDAIEQNAQLAGISAAKMHKAMDITLRTATLAGILLLAIITCRHFNIREPTSEIYRTTATEKSPAKGRLPTVNFLSNGQKHS